MALILNGAVVRPCPFCGQDPVFSYDDDGYYAVICCYRCTLSMFEDCMNYDGASDSINGLIGAKAAIIARWNRRCNDE